MKIQVVAIVASATLLVTILELVRQRRLMERYALLWLLSSLVLLGLAIWNDALSAFSDAIGVVTPSNALFLVAFGFVLVLLLHFSIAVSRLADQNKVLAQKLALLEERDRSGEAPPERRALEAADAAEEVSVEYAGRSARDD
jgi:hypothetical protein